MMRPHSTNNDYMDMMQDEMADHAAEQMTMATPAGQALAREMAANKAKIQAAMETAMGNRSAEKVEKRPMAMSLSAPIRKGRG